MKNLDFKNFQLGHWILFVQPLLLVLMVIVRLNGVGADGFWLVFAVNTILSLAALFVMGFPCKDGVDRRLAFLSTEEG